MIKPRRHYPDNAHCLFIELQIATYNIWIASKTTLPEAVAKHDDVVRARLKFFRVEKTTVCRRNAEQRKEVGRSRQTCQTFSCLTLLNHSVPFTLSQEDAWVMRPTLGMRRSSKDAHQLRRLGIRKCAKEKGIEDAKHRGVHANSQRQGECRYDGEAFMLTQCPKAIRHIPNKACHG